MTSIFPDHPEGDLAVQEVKPQLKEPRKYKVILVNDDYTPMDFVIDLLKIYFGMDELAATRVMLQVHKTGKGICGIYTRDVAETKVVQVNNFSQSNEQPLLCCTEPE